MHLNTFIFIIYNMGGPTEKKKDRPNANSGNGKPRLPEPKTDLTRRHGKVLFVDDEEAMVLLHKRMIERRESNVSVSIATSGKEALKILSKEDIGLVVIDYNMKGESGIDLICKIKELYPEIKTILHTTDVMTAEEDAKKKGLADLEILFKSPSTIGEFYQRVLDILQND